MQLKHASVSLVVFFLLDVSLIRFVLQSHRISLFNMTQCILYSPNVIWKIQNVSGYCKRKSPVFEFRNAKWQLKFIFHSTPSVMHACKINLKYLGDASTCENIIITSWCVHDGNIYFRTSIKFVYSELKEMTIFEETGSTFHKNRLLKNMNIRTFWKNAFFVCSFTVKNWTPTNGLQFTDLTDAVLQKSSCVASLCHDFEKLFNCREMSDVILTSKDKIFYAHKNILSARSDVFAEMFRNDTKESKEQTVDMTDIDTVVLEQFLRFMYSGKGPDLCPENVHQLYVLAHKYAVDSLKLKCGIFMVRRNDINNIFLVHSKELYEICDGSSTNFVSHVANVKALLCTEEWKTLFEQEPNFAHEAFIFFFNKAPC